MTYHLSFSDVCKTVLISMLMGSAYLMAVFLVAPILAIPLPLFVMPFLFLLSISLMAASLLRHFGTLGYRAEHSHILHATPLRFSLYAAPSVFLFLTIEGFLLFLARLSVIGYDVLSLTLLLRGVFSANITYLFDLSGGFLPYFIASVILLTALYTVAAYYSYRRGYRLRERERQALLAKDEAFFEQERKQYRTPVAKRFRFIPFVNLYPFFPWMFGYLLVPELKLRRFFPRLLIIVAAALLLENIPYWLAETALPPLLIYAVSIAPLYLLGILTCTIILADLKSRK